MSERLLIRLHPGGQLTWLVQDASGRALSASNSGAPANATISRARRVVALVPAEHVVLLETDAVTAKRAQLAKAVPFALEDQLASPVEDLHFALPDQVRGGRIGVAVAARDAMRGWIDTLAQHGVRADVMIPETLALPAGNDAATMMIETDRSLLRWGATSAIAFDTPALAQWLPVATPKGLAVHDFRSTPRQPLPVAVSKYHERQSDALVFLAAQLKSEPDFNLLQGEFAPSHRHVPAQRLWRRAALLAAAAIVLALTFAACDWLRLSRESSRLDASQREQLRSNLPEFANVAGDPRQLMESAMARMRGEGGGSGLLGLLNRIGPVFASTTRVSLKGIEFRNATLELSARAPDVPSLDLVREQIANLGLKAEVTAANSSDKGVEGRLRVSGAKP